MARSNFESLRVYRMAEGLADQVWGIVCEWDHFARDTVGKQLVRAADSIGANIAEGDGRGSYQDNRRFVRIARGSLKETQHFLRRAYRRDLLAQAQAESLKAAIDKLAPMLNAFLKSIGPIDQQGVVQEEPGEYTSGDAEKPAIPIAFPPTDST